MGNQWRLYALCTALVLYGAFSSPTPDNPGWAEILIGLCLLFAVGEAQLLAWGSGSVLWADNWRVWLGAYLLLVPTVIAILTGVTLAEIIRDLIPMGYALIPLLIIQLPKAAWRPLAIALFICGALLSLRYWLITDAWPFAWRALKHGDDYLYIPLEPAVLFTACLGPLWCLHRVLQGQNRSLKGKDYGLILLALYSSFLAMGAMAGLLMRAALALAFVVWLSYGVYQLRHRVGILIFLSAVLIFALIIFQPEILNRLWIRLIIKNEAVGFNARSEEFNMVLSTVNQHPITFLLGSGWGSTLISPAVANTAVHYTHNVVSYLWAKTGFLGVTAMLVYLWTFLRPLCRLYRCILGHVMLAAIPPLILAVTLYTSYKYLTFGILLLLMQLLVDAHPISQSDSTARAWGNRPAAG